MRLAGTRMLHRLVRIVREIVDQILADRCRGYCQLHHHRQAASSRTGPRGPGYTARCRDDQGRTRLERREPAATPLNLPAPPPVPDPPEAPEYYQMLEQQRRGREKGKKGRGRGGDDGKGKRGRGDGDGQGAEPRDRTRTPRTR